jgi:hypothetical protein
MVELGAAIVFDQGRLVHVNLRGAAHARPPTAQTAAESAPAVGFLTPPGQAVAGQSSTLTTGSRIGRRVRGWRRGRWSCRHVTSTASTVSAIQAGTGIERRWAAASTRRCSSGALAILHQALAATSGRVVALQEVAPRVAPGV